ncbi:MAG: peptidoglycan DD-metalloendopeptidase family protein [Luteimonas sp.]
MRIEPLARWCLALAIALAVLPAAHAQSSREAERKLERLKRELRDVAGERRKLEGQRGDASRQLRQSDEQVGTSTLALRHTETDLARQQAALADLARRRDALRKTLGAQRVELAGLLRAAYTIGDDAPLKLMLAQDRVADANRLLTYHRYVQAERARRIAALTAEMAGLEALEHEITEKQATLDASRAQQRTQLATLERDRKARAQTVAQLDARYRDRSSREQALGRDAKALERLLAQLRAAARRAAIEKAAADKAAARTSAQDSGAKPSVSSRKPVVVASAPAMRVGGLGWPLSGTLLAGFGGRMPDGRASTGLLIAAPIGTTVKAVGDGSVVFSEWMTGYGMILIIDHGNGTMSLYAHNDALLRNAGDQVKRGDAVASVGNSGGQGRPGLYFELRRDGHPIDPAAWLQKH